MRRIWHPNGGQQPAPMQDSQTGGVALVVLLPVATFAWDHRGRDHHAILAQLGDGAMNTVAAGAGFVAKPQWSAARLPQALDEFLSAAAVLGNVPYGVALPTSPEAVTATTIVSLCTSMPTNRVGCSMARLLCLRLHARPSGATLDHAHGETGHSFRVATASLGEGNSGR